MCEVLNRLMGLPYRQRPYSVCGLAVEFKVSFILFISSFTYINYEERDNMLKGGNYIFRWADFLSWFPDKFLQVELYIETRRPKRKK